MCDCVSVQIHGQGAVFAIPRDRVREQDSKSHREQNSTRDSTRASQQREYNSNRPRQHTGKPAREYNSNRPRETTAEREQRESENQHENILRILTFVDHIITTTKRARRCWWHLGADVAQQHSDASDKLIEVENT